MEDKITRIRTWLGTGSINLFGIPYAGKDTQGNLLADILGAPSLIGGGDILRSSAPDHIKQTINEGKLAPTDAYMQIVLPYLQKSEFDNKPLVLSSVGRWSGEEVGVINAAEQSNHPIKAVIYITIDEKVLRTRWEQAQQLNDRGERADDAEHILDVRLAEFRDKTLPVIDAYRERGLLVEIDGDAPVESITQRIIDALDTRASDAL